MLTFLKKWMGERQEKKKEKKKVPVYHIKKLI